MKKIIFSVLFFCLFAIGFAQNSAEKAGEYYTQKKYQAALQEYLSLPKNADIYYNIGNCYYRLGELGKAVLYYRRAQRLNPSSWQIEKNLQIAQKSLLDKPAELTKMEKLWESVNIKLSMNVLAAIIFVCLFLAGIFWIVGVYRPSGKYFAFFFLFLCLGVGYFTYQKQAIMAKKAVLIADVAQGFSGPGSDNKKVFTIHQGNSFAVLEQDGQWSKIKLEQGFVGWIKSEKLEKI